MSANPFDVLGTHVNRLVEYCHRVQLLGGFQRGPDVSLVALRVGGGHGDEYMQSRSFGILERLQPLGRCRRVGFIKPWSGSRSCAWLVQDQVFCRMF